MNITLFRLRPLIAALTSIRAAIDRANELKEIELNHVYGLTTRLTKAATAELEQTTVAYTDPAYEAAVRELEVKAGRALTEDEVSKVMAALEMEREDEE